MSKQGRMAVMKRQWHIIALLRSCGWVSLRKLSQETGVCDRTIRRDLETFESAGFPMQKDKDGSVVHWKWMRGSPCPCCGHAPEYSQARSIA